MYECPHCGNKTISGFRKLMAGKAAPFTCPQCGGESYSDQRSAMIGMMVLNFAVLAFVIPAFAFDLLWLLAGVIVVAGITIKVFILDKPMTKME